MPVLFFNATLGGFATSKPLQVFVPRKLETIEDLVARVNVILKYVDAALDVTHHSETPMPMMVTAGGLHRMLFARGLNSACFDAL